MSDAWYEDPGDTREFMELVELFCLSKPTAATRKPQLPRKASEKRESINAVLSGDERKIREKPSWFRINNTAVGNGLWRPARCKLQEEPDRCMLNIYVEETILQHSIFVHLLRCTDIRPVDRSLFFRNDCLQLHVKPGQQWLDSSTEEVIYLRFPSVDSLNTWVALLRSYAITESYGRPFAVEDGGLYRMWRQVQIEVSQGRNLGSRQIPPSATSMELSSSPPATHTDFDSRDGPGGGGNGGGGGGGGRGEDGSDMVVSCEIHINDALCGRTTVKKCTGSPEWYEQFTFSDLPPFGELSLHVYREKKILTTKPALVGSVQVPLNNFRRGESLEGWYPIISMNHSVSGTQVGELRLRMKVDEEVVLPTSCYGNMIQCLSHGNILDLMNALEHELKVDAIAEHILAIAVVRNVLMKDLFELAEREVSHTSFTPSILFRGNSVLTKVMELAMNYFGRSFLEASVGPSIRRLLQDKVVIEVDPVRSGKGGKDQEKHVDLLVYWCKEFWNQIYSVREECPQELRQLFQKMRSLVEKRFETEKVDMRWQSVSAFCFLRFIVPAILHPHMFGVCHGMPPGPVQRSLTLIAKALQSLANLNTNVQKEEYMKGLNHFLNDNMPAMIDYLKEVSTPLPDHMRTASSSDRGDHGRIRIMNALRERKAHTPTLDREALLFPPHLQDIPKHLALLTSSVVRSARQQRMRSMKEQNELLWAFAKACMEVETEALKRVSQLRPRPHGRPFSVSHINTSIKSRGDPGQLSPNKSDNSPTKRSLRKRANTAKASRPNTAPTFQDDPNWSNVWRKQAEEKPLPPLSPSLESKPRSSSGSASAQTHSTLRTSERRRSASLDKPVDGVQDENSRQVAWAEGPRIDLDEGKGRMRFFKGFLTRR